jgi:hypothetical protein
LGGLLRTDSPYLQQARTSGQQYANKRGLLNSSLGAQAAEGAAISAALPVASADAATENVFAGQRYGTELQKNLNEQSQGFNLDTMGVQQGYLQDNARMQTDLQKELNQQGQGFSLDTLAKQQEYLTGNARMQTDLQKELGEHGTQQQIEQQSYGVTANTQGAYLSAINEITNNAAVSINEIETAPNITQADKDKMIKNTVARRDADLTWTKSLYSNMPTWDMSWIDFDPMPAAPGIG